MQNKRAICVMMTVAILGPGHLCFAATNVAVFNFQMKSDTPDWKWLEKGLSDRIATDFVQERALTVVARDEMQLVAQKMNWVPEMATADAQRMGEIRQGLKIAHLVTGVYEVSGDRIRLVGQVVDVASRREVFRKEIAGAANDVLDLQRRLSAELLSWFTKKQPEAILETLPIWTRSLPAARALYEGMDFYDQGRYAEGWLKFRQASKADPGYLEAQYWVGKMYYFMQRYEHARRALEKFVYLDTAHPRLGDAIMEYVHTYEASGAAPEDLLALYERLGRQYPYADIFEGGHTRCDAWARYKAALLLGQIGRHREAVLLTAPALRGIRYPFMPALCLENLMQHQALTGEMFPVDVISDRVGASGAGQRQQIIIVDENGTPVTARLVPQRLVSIKQRNLDHQAVFDPQEVVLEMLIVAPSGRTFKGLTFFPEADGSEAEMEVTFWLPGAVHWPFAQPKADLAAARTQGMACNPFPRAGLVLVRCVLRVRADQSGPVTFTGFRLEPRLEEAARVGAVEVVCDSTSHIRVDVDGAFGRWYPGVVGPLAPGQHTVRVRCVEDDSPYAEWTAPVGVEAGKTTRVAVHLPWNAGNPWAAWTTALAGGDYPSRITRLNGKEGTPAILAEDTALRLVWSFGGDLWSAHSTDGKAFTAPRKLDLPVSSGWLETAPRLLRDEAGRFVLAFLSDRDAQHRTLPYLSWSLDFVHWSAPALVWDSSPYAFDLIQDPRGRLLYAADEKEGIRVLASGDGYRWEQAAYFPNHAPSRQYGNVRLLCRRDGQLVLLAQDSAVGNNPTRTLVRWLSGDGRVWSEPKKITSLVPWTQVEAAYDASSALVLLNCTSNKSKGALATTQWLIERNGGAWAESEVFHGLIPGQTSMAWHPRWGYLVAWMAGRSLGNSPHPVYGPYVMRGPTLPGIADKRQEPAAPKRTQR